MEAGRGKAERAGNPKRVPLSKCPTGSRHLAYIPDEFKEEPKEPFDREYMTKLYDLGYRQAKGGDPWRKAPPGFDVK